jgi:hypothetical protein
LGHAGTFVGDPQPCPIACELRGIEPRGYQRAQLLEDASRPAAKRLTI